MIRVSIADDERILQEASPDWISQQIERRRRDGLPVCVVVTINAGELSMRLSTPECGGGGGGRAPTPEEAKILSLWGKRGLNQFGWQAGNVIAFLKQLSL